MNHARNCRKFADLFKVGLILTEKTEVHQPIQFIVLWGSQFVTKVQANNTEVVRQSHHSARLLLDLARHARTKTPSA